MTNINEAIVATDPAVAALNMVPGFDPRKHMRKAISARTGREIYYLDLKYKKLWFRLLHPRGRIAKTILKITERIAIIEAKVFLDQDDTEPVSSFIARIGAGSGLGSFYIKDAQRAAENQALIDAGFGLQFCDMSQEVDPEPLDEGIPAISIDTSVANDGFTDSESDTQAPDRILSDDTLQDSVINHISTQSRTITDAIVLNAKESEASPDTETLTPEISVEKDTYSELCSPSPSTYTTDTPVEEILASMTLAEAVIIEVDIGTCKGWKLADVMEKRPASLKWYVNGYTGDNNILRAGAKLLLDTYFMSKTS